MVGGLITLVILIRFIGDIVIIAAIVIIIIVSSPCWYGDHVSVLFLCYIDVSPAVYHRVMATILVSTQSMFDVSCVIDNNYYRLSLLYIHMLYIDGYHFVVF